MAYPPAWAWLKRWEHKGREGPRLVPVPCRLAMEPYWGFIGGKRVGADPRKCLLAVIELENSRKMMVVPFHSQNLIGDRTGVPIPPMPSKAEWKKIRKESMHG